MRFMKQALLKCLRELQSYCELIIFTYVPRAYVDKLISTYLPEFKNIFSHILCAEEMVDLREYQVKDMGPLILSRPSQDIIVVDT